MLTFCCRCLISKPRPVLDSSSKNTPSMYFRFFRKISKWACFGSYGDFGNFGSRIDCCLIISSFSDYTHYGRKTSPCLWVLRMLRVLSILIDIHRHSYWPKAQQLGFPNSQIVCQQTKEGAEIPVLELLVLRIQRARDIFLFLCFSSIFQNYLAKKIMNCVTAPVDVPRRELFVRGLGYLVAFLFWESIVCVSAYDVQSSCNAAAAYGAQILACAPRPGAQGCQGSLLRCPV